MVNMDPEDMLCTGYKSGNLELVKLAVENGADIHISDDEALRYSCLLGHYSIVEFLLDNRANIHTCFDEAFRNACMHGHLSIVILLAKHGASINSMDCYGLRWSSEKGHIDVVKFLVENGCDIRIMDNCPLRWACENNRVDVAKFLLFKGSYHQCAFTLVKENFYTWVLNTSFSEIVMNGNEAMIETQKRLETYRKFHYSNMKDIREEFSDIILHTA